MSKCRKKSAAEIISSEAYFTKTDIQTVFRTSWENACRIFEKAEEVDDHDLDFRIYQNKVRKDSVEKVTGTNLRKLLRDLKSS